MKRFFFISLFVLSLGIGGLFLFSNQKEIKPTFYSPYEAKGYVKGENRILSFDIYSKQKESILKDKNQNTYTLVFDSLSIQLEDIEISSFDLGDYDLLRVKGSIPNVGLPEFKSETTLLKIQNARYTVLLSYGPISILDEEVYPLLSVSNLYASYSYMNGVLTLCGIHITLDGSYSYLTSVRLGSFAYGILSKVQFNRETANVIAIKEYIPSYNPLHIEEGYTLNLKSNTLFIPISYKSLCLLRSSYMIFTLDHKEYYFDTFDFMTNSFDFEEYESMMKEGVITYA